MKTLEYSKVYPKEIITMLNTVVKNTSNIIEIKVFDLVSNSFLVFQEEGFALKYYFKDSSQTYQLDVASVDYGLEVITLEFFATSDFLESNTKASLIIEVNLEGNLLSTDIPIVVKTLNKTLASFKYLQFQPKYLAEPTNLINRSLTSIPTWASIYNTKGNNYLKFVQPFYKNIERYYTLLNNAILSKVSNTITVALSEQPLRVIGNNSDQYLESFNTNHYFQVSESVVEDAQLGWSYYSNIDTLFKPIVNEYSSKVYINKFTKNSQSVVYIYGKDSIGNNIVETLTLLNDVTKETIFEYSEVSNIVASEDIQISNYLDCLHTCNYLEAVTTTHLAKVEKDFTFNYSKYSFSTNNTFTAIYYDNVVVGYLNTPDVTSIFVDKYNRIFWTDNFKVYGGLMSEDITKYTTNNLTTQYIIFKEPIYKDWSTIDVKVSDFLNYTNSDYCILMCKHNNTLYYYDYVTESLVTEKRFIEAGSVQDISLELLIADDTPYEIILLTKTLKINSQLSINLIKPFTESSILNKRLGIINSELFLIPNNGINFESSADLPKNSITFVWEGAKDLDFIIKIKEYSYGYGDTTISPDYMNNLTEDTANNIESLNVDFNLLFSSLFKGQDIIFTIGTTWYDESAVTTQATAKVYIKDNYGRTMELELTPKVSDSTSNIHEYTITIPNDSLNQISAVLNDEY